MRPTLSIALLFALSPLPGRAQDNVPLPTVPDLTLEPAPVPAEETPPAPQPGVPRVRMAPNAPAAPGVGPKIKVSPRVDTGESSIHGGQFRIFGGTKAQRDTLLRETEATRRLVASALRAEGSFQWPILVHIRTGGLLRPGQPQVTTAISQVPSESAFRFEINLHPVEGRVPGPLLHQELVRALLAEMMLREHGETDLGGIDEPPPPWILHGVIELLQYQAAGRPSEAFSAVFRLGRILTVEDIFAADPRHMDSVSLMVYRASCCGLILMMLDQPNGSRSFVELMKKLPLTPQDPAAAISQSFPGLNTSGNSLGKWWSLQLAAAAQPGGDEIQSPHETEAALAKALILTIPAAAKKPAPKPAEPDKKPRKGLFGKKSKEAPPETAEPATTGPVEVPITQFARALDHKQRSAIFTQVNLALTRLSIRSHPLYRPVIADYRSLVSALAEGKRAKDAPATLERLAALRKQLSADMRDVEDQLDLFEATQIEGTSGEFDGYLRAADAAELPPPSRRDPLSRYIDSMEGEYEDQ